MSNDWLSQLASVATIASLILIVYQLFKQSKSLEAEVRAYLHLDVKRLKFKNGRDMVALTIFNSGDSAAEDVYIHASGSTRWFALNGSAAPEFSKPTSKLRVLPGEELTFLLGPLRELADYKTVGIPVSVRYREIQAKKKQVVESQVLGFEPQKYLLERKIR